jgi:hypothetical protein
VTPTLVPHTNEDTGLRDYRPAVEPSDLPKGVRNIAWFILGVVLGAAIALIGAVL